MTQSNVLRICRWLGYLSLCLFLCSWLGCGGGAAKTASNEQDKASDSNSNDNKQQDTARANELGDKREKTFAAADGDKIAEDPPTTQPVAKVDDAAEPTEASFNTQGFSKFDMLMAALSIFVLAIFVGFEVITKVPPTLHTPLMSGSNAISGITLVGALLVAGQRDYAAWLGVLAVVFATINVIGGFWVTHRMLSMFQKR